MERRLRLREKKDNLKRIKARKVFGAVDYESMLAPYLTTHENLRYCDYVREAEIAERRILLIRHDIDHDPYTAVRMARWEAAHGLKSTYCVLHSAWYYGELVGDRYVHTRDMVETLQEIQTLGHEINFHNNLIATALRETIDPASLLKDELAYLRAHRIVISGTSTHGDRLCGALGFRNWELFKECCDTRFGGPREIRYTG